MRTGLHKSDKITEIYFNEASPMVEICAHNTALKHGLTAYAEQHPGLHKLTEYDESGQQAKRLN